MDAGVAFGFGLYLIINNKWMKNQWMDMDVNDFCSILMNLVMEHSIYCMF